MFLCKFILGFFIFSILLLVFDEVCGCSLLINKFALLGRSIDKLPPNFFNSDSLLPQEELPDSLGLGCVRQGDSVAFAAVIKQLVAADDLHDCRYLVEVFIEG